MKNALYSMGRTGWMLLRRTICPLAQAILRSFMNKDLTKANWFKQAQAARKLEIVLRLPASTGTQPPMSSISCKIRESTVPKALSNDDGLIGEREKNR